MTSDTKSSGTGAMPDASIVVLSFNRVDELRKTVPLILDEMERSRTELIVVDNASTDGSYEFVREAVRGREGARVIQNAENLGVGAGRNTGYRVARGRYVINLDDDTHIAPGLVGQTIDAFERLSQVGILAYRVIHHETGAAQNPLGEEECEPANFHGAGHAFRASLFDSAGYLDEGCSFGGEEIEMSLRARSVGMGVRYVPDIVVEHNSKPRAGTVGIERRIAWAGNYSRILHKYFPSLTATVFTCRLFFLDLFFFRRLGIRDWARFWRAVLRGRREGMQTATPLSQEVLEFYRNPNLRPAFGNVPLRWKVRAALRAGIRTLGKRNDAKGRE